MLILTTILSVIMTLPPTPNMDGEIYDTLKTATVTSSVKQSISIERLASPVSTVFLKDIEHRGIIRPKQLSGIVPNLYIPDYGSAMTSTIYVRGLGSRIDNPVLGLYIDDIPIIDKNIYDFDLMDIRRIDLFHGPQGTLYGRNSMCGVMSISTLSPEDINGGKVLLEYGSANQVDAKASYYKGNFGLSAGFSHSDGFYTNEYDGSKCGGFNSASLRLRYHKKITERLSLDEILSASFMKQDGYPYRQSIQGILEPINYNDTCSYRRANVLQGLKLHLKTDRFNIDYIDSYQFLFDKMNLDQDFTAASIFTMKQEQKEIVHTGEVIIKPAMHPKWWDSQTGYFILDKYNNMDAPVRFKRAGIENLILANVNKNIPPSIGSLDINDNSFPISSKFNIFTLNRALYHESYFTLGRWLLTAGARLDFEGNWMKYDSHGTLHYRFNPTMQDYKAFTTTYKGNLKNIYWEFLPKVSAIYDFGQGLQVFGNIAEGYKSGGYNTQIFSDILQNKMMTGMMNDLGVYFGNIKNQLTANNTSYKPETSIDFETGFKYHGTIRSEHKIDAYLSTFYIDTRNQQITIFPPGQTTGRMMANVGQSRSFGVETQFNYSYRDLRVNASYGYTNAKFIKYDDGQNDYSGNYIPYSPENTLYLRAEYRFAVNHRSLRGISIAADWNAIGKIRWNESNTLSQPIYGLLGADVVLDFNKFDIFLRTDNLTGKTYDTFYFKSMGNEFFQRGKPARGIIGITFNI